MAAVNLAAGILETGIEEDATDKFINARSDDPKQEDEYTVSQLETELLEQDYDVIFLHMKGIDRSGHKFGYGPEVPEYMEAVKKVDKQI